MESIDRAWECLEMPEERFSVEVRRPVPELSHAFKVSQIDEAIPRDRVLDLEIRSKLVVVETHPALGEVGDDTIEIDSETETFRQFAYESMAFDFL